MAKSADQFCGNCGNPRVVGQSVCPTCGGSYGEIYTGPMQIIQNPTSLPPTNAPEVAPTFPVGRTTPPPQYSGVMPTIQPTAAPSAPGKPPPLRKIIIAQGAAIILLLVVLIAVLLARSSPTTSSGPGTATSIAHVSPTLVPTATATPAPTATATSQPKPGDVLCNVNVGAWTGGSGDWKLLNGRLLNDGTGGGGDNGPTKVAPCQLGNISNYAVVVKMQIMQVVNGYTGNFGISVRGNPSSNGWQGYAACVGFYPTCNGGASLTAIRGNTSASGAFTPGTAVHTYRVEAKDNVINFIIDSGLVVTLTDNEFFTGSQVGIWCEGLQMEVFSFQVFAL